MYLDHESFSTITLMSLGWPNTGGLKVLRLPRDRTRLIPLAQLVSSCSCRADHPRIIPQGCLRPPQSFNGSDQRPILDSLLYSFNQFRYSLNNAATQN